MIIASNYLELQSAVEEYADNVGTNPDLVAACDDQPPEGREACGSAVNIASELVQLYAQDPETFARELYEELYLKVHGTYCGGEVRIWEHAERTTGRLEIWV